MYALQFMWPTCARGNSKCSENALENTHVYVRIHNTFLFDGILVMSKACCNLELILVKFVDSFGIYEF